MVAACKRRPGVRASDQAICSEHGSECPAHFKRVPMAPGSEHEGPSAVGPGMEHKGSA